tara:strand:- start:534 stop:1265 length:732 start_codon:yes stop_codon:yes gene_type:complete
MKSIVKELKGHSGATVSLYDDNTVVKNGFKKSRESAIILDALPFNTPKIYDVSDTSIVMEYINGDDIASFLEYSGNEGIDMLTKFIEKYFDWCLNSSTAYNFHVELGDKAIEIGNSINILGLIRRMNFKMPQSMIHGDFTFDNIIHKDGEFYLIDANPTSLNSIYFDGSKLRQDIDGYWFLRKRDDRINFKTACLNISEQLKYEYEFMNDNALYSLMLSRILPYCKDEETITFLTTELNKIWP